MNSNSQRQRRDDDRIGRETDRGQAEVLGAILLFGILIALLVLVQVTAVPGSNQQLEYEHSLRLQEDMREFESAADETAAQGGDRTVVVETGVQYPNRPFLLNPPPAMGALETTGEHPVEIENGRVVGVDPAKYDLTNQGFTTTTVRYRPAYNQYQNAPVTYYENGYLYRQFENEAGKAVVRPSAATNLVEGDRINLFLLEGELSKAGEASASVDIHPASAPTQSVRIQSTAPGLTLRLPTQADTEAWEAALADEISNGYVESVAVTNGVLEVRLESGRSYNLRMAKIGLGDQWSEEDPYYVTSMEDTGTVYTGENDPVELTVQVRDRYNNPVPNVPVEFEIESGTGTGTDSLYPGQNTPIETDNDGKASVVYTSQTEKDGVVVVAKAELDGVAGYSARETQRFTVNVRNSSAAQMTDGISGINPGAGSDLVELTNAKEDKQVNEMGISLEFKNHASTTMTPTEARISYYLTDDQSNPPSSATWEGGTLNPSLEIPGQFEAVNGPSIGAGQTESVRLATPTATNPGGDFMIMSITFSDGTSEYRLTYFVGIKKT